MNTEYTAETAQVQLNSSANNLTSSTLTPSLSIKTLAYHGAAKSCQLLSDNVIDLRPSFIDRYFTARVIGQICGISLGRDKSVTIQRVMTNYCCCNGLAKLSPILIDKLVKARPDREILIYHRDLLTSATKFHQAIVDYFTGHWASLDLKQSGKLDLDLAANIAQQFLQPFRSLELVETLKLATNCNHKHNDEVIEDHKKCLYAGLVRNPVGRHILVKELTVVLASYFGLTAKILPDLTGHDDMSQAIDELVFYHGGKLLELTTHSLIDCYYYDTTNDVVEL